MSIGQRRGRVARWWTGMGKVWASDGATLSPHRDPEAGCGEGRAPPRLSSLQRQSLPSTNQGLDRYSRGKRLGRQPGQRPKSDRLAPMVLALVAKGRSYRLVGREVGLGKNTVADIVKRSRTAIMQAHTSNRTTSL
jgi:hypothetical protein